MTYNTALPPKIVRVNQTGGGEPDDWELRDATGNVIATYSRVGMSLEVWWEDILTYIRNNTNSTKPLNAVEDITLLMMQQDWTVEA